MIPHNYGADCRLSTGRDSYFHENLYPAADSTLSPKRVIARIRMPVRVSTSSPFAGAASARGPCG